MTNTLQFTIDPQLSLDEVEETLRLSMIALEGLFGAAQVRLNLQYTVDRDRQTINVRATGDAGEAIVRVFTSLLLREFGEDAFTCRRNEARHPALPSEN